MSALALLSLLADLPRVSPLSSCNSGSTLTFEHTSVNSEAVRSLMLLCLRVGKPPLLQDKACSTVNLLRHTHSVGSSLGIQPYRRAIASQKAPLCKLKLNSLSGNVLSQEEALFS